MWIRRELLAMLAAAAIPRPAMAQDSAPDGFDDALDTAFARYAPPALGAAIVTPGGVAWAGVRGVRRFGGTEAVTIDDPWHLGSCTKAMTAAVYARLVEQGRVGWAQPLPTVFAGLSVHPGWAETPVTALMMHRSGLSDAPWLTALWGPGGRTMPPGPRAERRRLTARVLALPPPGPAGRYDYANLNYIVVGAAIEAITGEPFETVMRRELFAPLGLRSAGFGAPRTMAPWPHQSAAGVPVPIDPARRDADNPAMIAPAGTVHMAIADYARFLGLFLNAGNDVLSPASVERLITPFGDDANDYALGWVTTRRASWARGAVLGHEGSNTRNYARCAVAPAIGRAVIAVANDGERGKLATGALIDALTRAIGGL